MGLFKKKEEVPSLPPVPSLSTLPRVNSNIPEPKKNLPELPSFPSVPKNEGMNQEIVKSAVSDNSNSGENPFASEEVNDLSKLGNIPEEVPSLPEFPKLPPIQISPPKEIVEVKKVAPIEMSSAQAPTIKSSILSESSIPDLPKAKPLVQTSEKQEVMPIREIKKESPISVPQMDKDNSREPVFVRIDKFQQAKNDFEEIRKKVSEIEKVLGKIKEVKSREEKELEEWSQNVEKLKLRLIEIDSGIFNQI
jgi:hypothetical protein